MQRVQWRQMMSQQTFLYTEPSTLGVKLLPQIKSSMLVSNHSHLHKDPTYEYCRLPCRFSYRVVCPASGPMY